MGQSPTGSSQQNLLVVDDNETFRGALKICLEDAGYKVTTAENGAAAKDILSLINFAAVVSDIRMAPGDGVDLLKHVQGSIKIPVILMTGFAEVLETHSAVELGAAGFLAKPFQKSELLTLLTSVLNGEDMRASLDDEYCKISIEDILYGSQIKFSIFVRISEEKYLKIAHTGENLDADRIGHYQDRGIKFLYLKKGDFQKYLGFNLAVSKSAQKNSAIGGGISSANTDFLQRTCGRKPKSEFCRKLR